jgi:hypothetical protein
LLFWSIFLLFSAFFGEQQQLLRFKAQKLENSTLKRRSLSTVFLQKKCRPGGGKPRSLPSTVRVGLSGGRQQPLAFGSGRAATTSGGWLAAFGGGLRHSAAGCNVWRRQAAVKCGQVKRLAHFALNFFLKQCRDWALPGSYEPPAAPANGKMWSS